MGKVKSPGKFKPGLVQKWIEDHQPMGREKFAYYCNICLQVVSNMDRGVYKSKPHNATLQLMCKTIKCKPEDLYG